MKYSEEWFSLDIFWYCETKKLTEDRDITPEIKETSKDSTTKKFGTESQKKSDGNTLILSLHLSINFSLTEKF